MHASCPLTVLTLFVVVVVDIDLCHCILLRQVIAMITLYVITNDNM
jgi:hypothetical protein